MLLLADDGDLRDEAVEVNVKTRTRSGLNSGVRGAPGGSTSTETSGLSCFIFVTAGVAGEPSSSGHHSLGGTTGGAPLMVDLWLACLWTETAMVCVPSYL